jgi:hypothetical protein
MDTDNTNGQMVESTKESGRTIRCTERVFSHFQTAEYIKELTGTTKRTGVEFTSGLTVGDLRASSTRVSSMEMEFLSRRTGKEERLSLRMERESDG